MAPKTFHDWQEDVDIQEDVRMVPPPLYRVFLLNDDYTPMDFVVWILETIFHKPSAEAHRLMMNVHTQGSGLCGLYPYDIAQTKVWEVKKAAQEHQHPLECHMEPEGS